MLVELAAVHAYPGIVIIAVIPEDDREPPAVQFPADVTGF